MLLIFGVMLIFMYVFFDVCECVCVIGGWLVFSVFVLIFGLLLGGLFVEYGGW